MEDVGLIWNPKKCAVAHFKRGVRVAESTGLLMSDGNVKIPTLEDGQQYKFLGVLESLRQEERIVLQCAAREPPLGLPSRDSIQSICSASNVLLYVDTALANNRIETG